MFLLFSGPKAMVFFEDPLLSFRENEGERSARLGRSNNNLDFVTNVGKLSLGFLSNNLNKPSQNHYKYEYKTIPQCIVTIRNMDIFFKNFGY